MSFTQKIDAGLVETPLAEQSDEDLLLLYRERGDRRAFETLVYRYEKELYSFLRRYLGDGAMAEDVFQAAFLQVHLNAKQYEAGRKFRPWLYAIATHKAIDAQRRNRRHKMISLDREQKQNGADDLGSLLSLLTSSADESPSAEVELAELRTWVRKAVLELPDVLRAAVLMVYFQGLTYRDAAESMGVPVGTAKSRVHTAILKLNEAWRRAQGTGES